MLSHRKQLMRFWAKRRKAMLKSWRKGASYAAIARDEGISRQRVRLMILEEIDRENDRNK